MRCEGHTFEGRCHNITIAKLYNCLHQRRCPARNCGEAQGKVSTHKRHTCKHLYNFRYVKEAATFSVQSFPFELPGEAAAGEGLAAVAGLHPALCQPRTGLHNWGPAPPNCSAPVPSRISVIKMQPVSPATTSVLREHPAALRSSAAGSFQAVTPLPPQAPEEESHPSTPRYGFAVFIPARHRRCWGVPGLTAASLLPSFRQWAVPAQAPERVCPPTTSVSSAVPGSLTSPFHGAPEPAVPHAARHSPGPRSTRSTRSAPLVTGRL